jgi:hypothetical protein
MALAMVVETTREAVVVGDPLDADLAAAGLSVGPTRRVPQVFYEALLFSTRCHHIGSPPVLFHYLHCI